MAVSVRRRACNFKKLMSVNKALVSVRVSPIPVQVLDYATYIGQLVLCPMLCTPESCFPSISGRSRVWSAYSWCWVWLGSCAPDSGTQFCNSWGVEGPTAKLWWLMHLVCFPPQKDQLHNVLQKPFLTRSPLGMTKILLMTQRGNMFLKTRPLNIGKGNPLAQKCRCDDPRSCFLLLWASLRKRVL